MCNILVDGKVHHVMCKSVSESVVGIVEGVEFIWQPQKSR